MLGRHLIGFASAIPIIGAGIAGIVGNVEIRKGLNQAAAGYGTQETLSGTTEKIGKRLQEEIKKLQAAGRLDPNKTFDTSNLRNIAAVQGMLKELLPDGYSTELKTIAEQIKEHEKAVEDYTRRKAEAEKSRAEEAERHARETAELNKEYENLERDNNQTQTEMNRVGESIPTVEDLAGRTFTERLNKQYGKGGRFDLGRGGTGVFGQAARESELAAKQMQWDIEHGNGSYQVVDGVGQWTGQAGIDRQRRIAADNLLGAAGLDTPQQKLEQMKYHLKSIQDSMLELNRRAAHDGIKIADDDSN
jgi:hypothetical protein